MAEKKSATSRKKKIKRQVTTGKAFIHASYNNTIVTITDNDGHPVTWSSGGVIGYKGSRKGTPYAAQLAAMDAAKKAQGYGMSSVEVVVRGTGAGREQAIRALQASGLQVRSIVDDTPTPHNGCRPRKKFRKAV
ncbi:MULTISPECIES: 30S ribosomal protein S11 [Meiothermus]|jgi:small subunit ribosomal protein S11|uniref:Small ribosomal subunit protein uS11 n=3 Tax=Meiothermus TaxID=65551 RepID=D3PN16_MEIRD|nr:MULTISPECIES: 30S ribosomal protein S11 [Meiothermus]MCX7801530.1 30S ribosomal protein S11 [Meiothermus ruber]ADD29343.1 ribosomal protein S11 [Meiothermus ruber DSM 1279]AGK05207.1 30S ribosomal protein S11 [Meiothermus ruber DSM 1279]AWR85791.1 ribosomal protein S11 [Meiothermus taiwanensis WR-220]KIQ54813.1 30S ribosomal protein S11 [Meiothermus taiwanensis]